jgi:hypothetical protein
VTSEGQEKEEFGGWVELTAAIETARQQTIRCETPRTAETA